MKIEGGCLCGRVRYAGEADPIFVGLCHCTHCQKHTGSAFSGVVAVPTPALTVTGPLKSYVDRGDSGAASRRSFCAECGSSVLDDADMMPDVTMVLVGSLDDPSWFRPQMEIYTDSAQSWVALGGDRPRFGKMPPRG